MINKSWQGRRYYSLDAYLKNTYGQKFYKIPLSARVTCPNRDGSISTGGCIFCSQGGSGDFAGNSLDSITDQINIGKEKLTSKYPEGKYIAYFQSFTSTYAPVDYLQKIFFEAINHPDVAILSIATRPDCLDEAVLALLEKLNQIKPVWVELGLQTSRESVAEFINRGYKNCVYDTAVSKLKAIDINVITHISLGLPGEDKADMISSVKYAVARGTNGLKLQLMHVLRDTKLAEFLNQEIILNEPEKDPESIEPAKVFSLLTQEEYISILAACLEVIPEDVVIHRLTGDGPKDLLIGPLWSGHKKNVLNNINHFLKENDSFQGKMV